MHIWRNMWDQSSDNSPFSNSTCQKLAKSTHIKKITPVYTYFKEVLPAVNQRSNFPLHKCCFITPLLATTYLCYADTWTSHLLFEGFSHCSYLERFSNFGSWEIRVSICILISTWLSVAPLVKQFWHPLIAHIDLINIWATPWW